MCWVQLKRVIQIRSQSHSHQTANSPVWLFSLFHEVWIYLCSTTSVSLSVLSPLFTAPLVFVSIDYWKKKQNPGARSQSGVREMLSMKLFSVFKSQGGSIFFLLHWFVAGSIPILHLIEVQHSTTNPPSNQRIQEKALDMVEVWRPEAVITSYVTRYGFSFQCWWETGWNCSYATD